MTEDANSTGSSIVKGFVDDTNLKEKAVENNNIIIISRQQEANDATTVVLGGGDLESVQSGLSSISGDGSGITSGNVIKKKTTAKNTPKKSGRSFSPKMDTMAHSRKSASRLAVPTGGDASSPFPRKPGTLTSPTLSLSAWQYWSRLTDLRQMDMQSALDQMKTLLSPRPQVVYKTSYYRKQTKNHWARDDPAFLFLQGVFLIISAVAYSVAFRISLTGSISFLLYTVVWNWLGMGVALATLCREIANRQLVGQQTASTTHVRQQVEWLYAFDIHCNSFFPVFVVLYGIQFFMLPLVLGEGLVPLIFANSLYAMSLSWYWYITHLGYRSLPFLGNTEVFLFPIAAIALVFVGSLVGYPFGFGWNAARVMARFYFM